MLQDLRFLSIVKVNGRISAKTRG